MSVEESKLAGKSKLAQGYTWAQALWLVEESKLARGWELAYY
jgi:hypothetical protein